MNKATANFARAFGDELRLFLDQNGISVTAAASKLGLNKQTLSSYWTDNPEGKRPNARAELLFLACRELGFVFEFEGSTISAAHSRPTRNRPAIDESKHQLRLPFGREFLLAERKGSVSVSIKRPPGEIRLAVTLKTAS